LIDSLAACGNWCSRWRNFARGAERKRKRVRVKLAPAAMPLREVRKLRDEHLRPLNSGLESIGGATNFTKYVDEHYIPVALKAMPSSTQDRSEGVIENYLKPTFGKLCLRDLTPMTLDKYFADLVETDLSQESIDKVRDVLASILKRAIRHGLIVKNPTEGLELPRAKTRRSRSKPYITPAQFDRLIAMIPEPYATMVYVAVYTGLRVSELAALRWNDIHEASICIDERYCRGDWGEPKSEASCATIAVNRAVIARIHRLKLLTVKVRAGRAVRKYRVVKSDAPDALVFQSVKDGRPMRDNNILTRFLKPAARELGLAWVNWRCLRTSHATWLKLVGADVKDAQAQMRHSRASTTLDIYQQFVPESQRAVVDRLTSLPRPHMIN
jgi:integrase